MNSRASPIVFGVACLCGSAILHAETFPVAQDTYGTTTVVKSVTTSTVTSADGGAGSLAVGKEHAALLRFDVGASGIDPAIVTHARLVIYFPIVTKTGGLNLHAVTQDWSEHFTGPARHQPAYTASPIATIPPAYVVAKQFVTIDVTEQVQAWLTTPGSDFGFALDTTDGTASVLIGAKEGPATGYPATLEVDDAVVSAGANVTVVDVVASGNVTAAGNVTASGNVSGNGASLTSLNATSISSGTLADARLSANVALLDAANTFSAPQTFSLVGAGTMTLGGDLGLPVTTGAAAGVITQGAVPVMHSYGTFNFFAGATAGNFTLTGNTNTIVGVGALAADTTGSSNTASGFQALSANTTGSANLAGGFQTLTANTTGNSNTALGYGVLYSNLTGNENAALGSGALGSNTAGSNNTAVGGDALNLNTTGAGNIALGFQAGSNLTTGSNDIDIGHAGVAGESAIIRIGDGVTQTDTYLTGVIHGDGSGLTGIPSGNLAGSITSAQIATGAVGSAQLASGLTLAGTTAGAFSGSLAGNATSATSATSFTGSLSGDVTGTQPATVVSTVGGLTAVNVAAGANLANASTSPNTPGAIVLRDSTGSFGAGSITLAGDLGLPPTTGATVGVITQGGSPLIHSFGTDNFFAGAGAGNFTTTGSGNMASGNGNLAANTAGINNTAAGINALFSNTTGNNNTAVGALALKDNTVGNQNTAVGEGAVIVNTSGGGNTGIGFEAIGANTTGGQNTGIGKNALLFNTTGSNNTAAGNNSLESNTTGAFNIALGFNAGSDLTTGSNNIDIGHAGVAGETAIIRVGDGVTQTDTYLTGVIHGNGSGLTGIASSALSGSITSAQIASGAIGNTQLASGLTLAGTTAGTFSGSLAGNATTASGFTGSLTGDVTGTQSATVVSAVGGSTAANVHGAEQLANAATSSNTAGALVLRDSTGSFSADNLTIAGEFNLPATAGATAGVINMNGGSFIHAFGTSNFFAGAGAGNFTATGTNNTAVGVGALPADTSGNNNTAVGNDALLLNTTASQNAAFGVGALRSVTTGGGNTAAGTYALYSNTTGGGETAAGNFALYANTNGARNAAFGSEALSSNTTGSFNVAAGYQALDANTTAGSNTAMGYQALNANTTGAGNIAIGYLAGSNLTTGNNNIEIGHAGVAGESGVIRLGTAGAQTTAFIAGVVGVTTSQNNAVPVVIDSTGNLGTISSSRRYKEDINDMGDASERIQALRPVTFRYKKPYADGGKPIQYGLIAEEVAEVFPELAVRNAQGQPETVRYQDLTPLLLNEVQKLRAEKEKLQQESAELRSDLDQLKGVVGDLKKQVGPPSGHARHSRRGAVRND